MNRIHSLLTAALLSTAAPLAAQTTTFAVGATTVTAAPLTTGLTIPWELVWGPDNFLWMTERGGRISRVNPTTGTVLPLLQVPDVTPAGESGLLGMVLHPDFATLPYLYIVYNYTDNGLKEKLVRYTYSATAGTLSSPLVLLDGIISTTTHSGSRLLILADRTLLMSTGDAQLRPEAQNMASLNGKILRLNLDGTVPADNPTPGSPVYSFGHRNPQGLTQLPTGQIISSEHGDAIEDEINLIEKGRNYGWPNVEGVCNTTDELAFCAANNVREPLVTWTPTIATAGLQFYNSPAIPEWRGSLLLATLKASKLIQLRLNATNNGISGQQDFLTGVYGRLRAVCVSPQGRVYLSTSNNAAGADQLVVLENRDFVVTATTGAAAVQLRLYPNPAQRTVMLELPAPTAAATVIVRDALGRTVRTIRFPAGQTRLTLSVEGLTPGLYSVQTGRSTQRLVVE
ncbi:PQQ-dependent sugar dehydrogenase [Hymenobacter rubripertinctus]|uniref:T9SS C-terminal target domain-containing protein n=1 Tax=Hymenobacter rubripertinctus TaxID=2029981 RepID=A0A418R9Y5_9BACT|nr:PQQ-dependent sugar dehydrogenase [Hymenobacter rubripertinctus]RIY14297.1 T9SS C-terminal target domain-containing protein [Hymenobacter rubripertinctus]